MTNWKQPKTISHHIMSKRRTIASTEVTTQSQDSSQDSLLHVWN